MESTWTTKRNGDHRTYKVTSPPCSNNDVKAPSVRFIPSYRLFVTFLSTMALMACFATQTSMNSALICMTDVSNSSLPMTDSNGSSFDLSPFHNSSDGHMHFNVDSESDSNSTERILTDNNRWRFAWSPEETGWSQSVLFLVYYIVQLPSGLLPGWFGTKRTLTCSLALAAISQLLAVPCALMGLGWFYLNRFLTGIVIGPLYICAITLTANWAPQTETSLMMSLSGLGLELGAALAFSVPTWACSVPFQGGWSLVFYTIAGWNLMTALLGLFFLTDFPSSNPYIGAREKAYILKHRDGKALSKNKVRIPWKAVLSSGPVWAFLLAQMAAEWIFYFMVTQVPVYLDDVLMFSDTDVSLICSLPFIAIIPIVTTTGYISDTLITKGLLTTTNTRKMNVGISTIGPSVLIICLGYVPSHAFVLAFALNVLLVSSLGFSYVGYVSNVADLTTNNTGCVTGWGQIGSTWVSFVIPVISSAMTRGNSRGEWQTTFYLAAAINVTAFLIFAVWGSGDLQPWDKMPTSDDNVEESHQRYEIKRHDTDRTTIDTGYDQDNETTCLLSHRD